MTCWANRHSFIWGTSTTTDSMPLTLRCECGAVRRQDALATQPPAPDAVAEAAEARIAELTAATARLVKAHDEAVAIEEGASPARWGKIGREMDAAVEQCRAALDWRPGAERTPGGEGVAS